MLLFESYLTDLGLPAEAASIGGRAIGVVVIALLAWLTNVLTRNILMRVVERLTRRTTTDLDDVLLDKGAFARLSHIAPALVIYTVAPLLLPDTDTWSQLLRVVVNIYTVLIGYLVLDAVINAGIVLFERNERTSHVAIRSLAQAVKVVAAILTFILALSAVFDRSPLYFVSGLGALTAVLLLVFRDAILGLVAGIQLSVNDIVRHGDWIEMSSQGADGDVIDISLTVVKVQNWDKTVTSIPTYALVSQSFRNWRGMTASGGRRVKRSIFLDTDTVGFASADVLERVGTLDVFRPWLTERLAQIAEHNKELGITDDSPGNGRKLTNAGLFRAYCVQWLHQHPMRHPEMTFLVRQLQPEGQGLPIEFYLFANTTEWVKYEDFQSDIMDHLFAILPVFGLRAFQSPSSAMIDRLGATAPRALTD
jgi:miniconductance mechanosensitive channel